MVPGAKIFLRNEYKYHIVINSIDSNGIHGRYRSLVVPNQQWVPSGYFPFNKVKEIRVLQNFRKTKIPS